MKLRPNNACTKTKLILNKNIVETKIEIESQIIQLNENPVVNIHRLEFLTNFLSQLESVEENIEKL